MGYGAATVTCIVNPFIQAVAEKHWLYYFGDIFPMKAS